MSATMPVEKFLEELFRRNGLTEEAAGYTTALLCELVQEEKDSITSQNANTDDELSSEESNAAKMRRLISTALEGVVDDVEDLTDRLIVEFDLKGMSFDFIHGTAINTAQGNFNLEDLEVDVDTEVKALLSEDSEWHMARVVAYLGPDSFRVLFTEFNKEQIVSRKEIVLLEDLEENTNTSNRGTCAMCDNICLLTRHHLIPRTVHPIYLKRGLTKGFLSTCVDICRKCHSAVHRLYSEPVLAESYNTLEKLLADPSIQKWISYARTNKKSTKWDMQMLRAQGRREKNK